MSCRMMTGKSLFDEWVDRYDKWFATPIGRLVRAYEKEVISEFLKPSKGETILDAGCGSGVFTKDILRAGAHVVGLDLSLPMLIKAGEKTRGNPFYSIKGDMADLPFGDDVFDKTVSVTALEFINDATGSISELFRVTKPHGSVVVATLNSLSPWAVRRKKKAGIGNTLFKHAIFRSPDEIKALAPFECLIKTAIHFQKNDTPAQAEKTERLGQVKGLKTGAFIIARWKKSGGSCW